MNFPLRSKTTNRCRELSQAETESWLKAEVKAERDERRVVLPPSAGHEPASPKLDRISIWEHHRAIEERRRLEGLA